jgi:hypothetical protein
MTTLQSISAAVNWHIRTNENFAAVSPAALFAQKASTTTGLTLGYYGGILDGVSYADGTHLLTASTTRYVVAARATGVVSSATGTTNWNDQTNYLRMGVAVVGTSTITTWTDWRQAYGGSGGGGGGGSGDVVGPSGATDNSLVVFDSTSGKLVKQAKLTGAHIGPGAYDANALVSDDSHWLEITNDPAVVSGIGTAGKQLLRFNSYGAAGYGGNVHFCRYRGTEASPTAVQSGDSFMSFGFRGWDSSAALSQSAASYAVQATENWTGSAHGTKFLWQVTPNGSTTRGNGMELASTGLSVTGDVSATGKIFNTESIIIAASDESTAITTGTGKVTFRMPYAFTLSAVRASVTTAPTGSTIIIDIKESGGTIFSTKLSIDATEKTSTTAASAAVISDPNLADDAEITINFDQVGSTVAGAGVKVYLIGKKA